MLNWENLNVLGDVIKRLENQGGSPRSLCFRGDFTT